MCLILFALQQHEEFPLVVVANRDEYYARPTQSAHWWEDEPEIFAGRDLEAQGTWMGVNRAGCFAAVTNVREPGAVALALYSRGDLPRGFLAGNEPAEAYIDRIETAADSYAGFNLLLGDCTGLWFFSNRQAGRLKINPGIYGVSNGKFDEPWPKLQSGKKALGIALRSDVDDEQLVQILTDKSPAQDSCLPKTGVPLDIERRLSSRFIRSNDYGTRASSVVKFGRDNNISFVEQNFDSDGKINPLISEKFRLEPNENNKNFSQSCGGRKG